MKWPESLAGVAVNSGDLNVGEADGVVVIPREDVAVILELAQKKVDIEARRIAAIKAGELRPGWLDKELRAAGVLAEGESL